MWPEKWLVSLERNLRYVSYNSKKCESGAGLSPGTGRRGRARVLGFLDRVGRTRQNRTRHRCSSPGYSSVGSVRVAESYVAPGRSLALALADSLLRLSSCGSL